MSTGEAWTMAYAGHYKFKNVEDRSDGLHHFNFGDNVCRSEDGKRGVVHSRTALTARVRWEGGSVTTIDQMDPTVYVIGDFWRA